MTPVSGAISTIIIIVSGRYLWFHYCMRIYNGTKFSEEVVSFDSDKCKAENDLEPQYRTNSRYYNASTAASTGNGSDIGTGTDTGAISPIALSLRKDVNDSFYSKYFKKKKHFPTFKEFVHDEEAGQMAIRDSASTGVGIGADGDRDTIQIRDSVETLEIRDSMASTTTYGGYGDGNGFQGYRGPSVDRNGIHILP